MDYVSIYPIVVLSELTMKCNVRWTDKYRNQREIGHQRDLIDTVFSRMSRSVKFRPNSSAVLYRLMLHRRP